MDLSALLMKTEIQSVSELLKCKNKRNMAILTFKMLTFLHFLKFYFFLTLPAFMNLINGATGWGMSLNKVLIRSWGGRLEKNPKIKLKSFPSPPCIMHPIICHLFQQCQDIYPCCSTIFINESDC